jgi:hypothetical protein
VLHNLILLTRHGEAVAAAHSLIVGRPGDATHCDACNP